jgi:exosortase
MSTYFLQVASTASASFFLQLVGEPAWRDGIILHLRGSNFEVLPQCCGLNANLALLATATGLAMLFLRRPAARLTMICAAIPLGILRNALRIATVAMLCEHIGPQMNHSWVHRHGGVLFFGLSLVPLLLRVLRTLEKQKGEL